MKQDSSAVAADGKAQTKRVPTLLILILRFLLILQPRDANQASVSTTVSANIVNISTITNCNNCTIQYISASAPQATSSPTLFAAPTSTPTPTAGSVLPTRPDDATHSTCPKEVCP